MASNSEYEQRRCFEDEYPKYSKIGDVNLITIKDGFGGLCTFVPHPIFDKWNNIGVVENLKTK